MGSSSSNIFRSPSAALGSQLPAYGSAVASAPVVVSSSSPVSIGTMNIAGSGAASVPYSNVIVHPAQPMPGYSVSAGLVSSAAAVTSTPMSPIVPSASAYGLSSRIGSYSGVSPYAVAGGSYVSPVVERSNDPLLQGGVVSTRPISREELKGSGHLIDGDEAAAAGIYPRPAASVGALDMLSGPRVMEPQVQVMPQYEGEPGQFDGGQELSYPPQNLQPMMYSSQPAYYDAQPGVYEQPGMYEQPGAYEQPGVYEQPGIYEQPGVYEQYEPAYGPGGEQLVEQGVVYGESQSGVMYSNQGIPQDAYLDGGDPYGASDMQPAGGYDDLGDQSQMQQGEPYTVLPVPEEYMRMLQNLDAIEAESGCRIQTAEPLQGTAEWEVSLFGSPESRRIAHEMIENTIAEELSRAEAAGEYYEGN